MEIAELQFSNLFLRLIIWGTILFIFFRLTKFISPFLIKKKKNKQLLGVVLLVVETIAWIIFLSGFVWSLDATDNAFIYIVLAIIFIIIFWLSRFWVKDTVAGVIFRTSSRFHEGDMIQSENYTGVIKKFGNHTIELESRDGKTIFLPYSKIMDGAQIKSESISKQSGFTFILNCEAKKEYAELIGDIKKSILNLPWSSAIKKPQVSLMKQTDNNFEIEVTVYPIDKSQQNKIEKHLRERFERK